MERMTVPSLDFPHSAFGVVAQVYSMRSNTSWGMGGFTEIATVGEWLADQGGSVLGLSPLGEPIPTAPREPSPYSTSTRWTLDPTLIDVMALGSGDDYALAELDDAGRSLNDTPLIDRDRTWALKRRALEHLWESAGRPTPSVDDATARAATYNALAEHFGAGWPQWPDQHHDVQSGLDHARRELSGRIDLWAWIAQQAELQFASLRSRLNERGVRLMGDLPLGFARGGADDWLQQPVLAEGVSIGAPPDEFNPAGQDWGLPAFDPERWRTAGYASFIEMLQSIFRRFDGLRIDHIMGLFRCWWIGAGSGPADGSYVRHHDDDLFRLVIDEAVAAGAFVVGEDLGTVEQSVRDEMRIEGVAGTRVALFEDVAPEEWPLCSLGTLSTHDLPTVRSALDFTDPRPDDRLNEALRRFAALEGSATTDELVLALHRRLGAAGSGLVMATLEDVAGSGRRVNLPGTTTQYPNWKIPLPLLVDALSDDDRAGSVLNALSDGRR